MQSMKLFHYHLKFTKRLFLNRRLLNNVARFKQQSDLNFAITEAEKIVGYPTSFLNLRWLLTDEFASIAIHFRKLITTNHPLMVTVRKLFIGNNMPAWGLIVLLVSKAFGLNSEFSDKEKDLVAGVLHSQRTLAEVTEMIRTSNFIHKCILNKDDIQEDHSNDLFFGNKITLLSGDYLLAKCYQELACLRNQHLNELMYSTVRDMVDADFMGLQDKRDQPYPSMPLQDNKKVKIKDNFENDPYEVQEVLGYPLAEWTLRTILAGGTLLGKSCQGALHLAKHSKEVQNVGYLFGKNIALAGQAKMDREAFVPGVYSPFSLVSAPVMFHLQHDPHVYEKIAVHKNDVSQVDYKELKKLIENGPALEETKKLENDYLHKAMDLLNQLPPSDSRTALENIIYTML